jgi:hypothetical protein
MMETIIRDEMMALQDNAQPAWMLVVLFEKVAKIVDGS